MYSYMFDAILAKQHSCGKKTFSCALFSVLAISSHVPGSCSKTPGGAGHTRPGQKTPGGAGTHTGHTGHADAQRHTDQSHNQPNPPTTTNTPHVSATTEAAADSTAASPKPTAPRGRLRRGRPQQTRPCLRPLPERLPAPAQRRSAK